MRSGLFVVIVVGLAVSSVAGDRSPKGGREDKPVIQVHMQGKKFVPDHITVKAGDIVEWVNEPEGHTHQVTTDPDQAADAHNVESPRGAKIFDSREIKAGQTFRYQFTVPGLYRYSCPPHETSGMMGQIDVQP